MKLKTILPLMLSCTLLSCAYDNKGDDAQRRADQVYKESVDRCNEIKGEYTGTLQSPNQSINMEAGIYCVTSAKSETDKDGNVLLQVSPEIIIYRKDIPIPSVLSVLYQGSGIGMSPKPSGGGSGGGQGDQSNDFKPVPGSLASSISFDKFTSFEGSKVGNDIVGEIRTTKPVGILTLRKTANDYAKSESALEIEIENRLEQSLSPFMRDYHGCIQFESGRYANILLQMKIENGNYGGKLVKFLRSRFQRFDMPGSPHLASKQMSTALNLQGDFLTTSFIALAGGVGSNYRPRFDGTLHGYQIPEMPKKAIETGIFVGNFSSDQEEGKLCLFPQDKEIKDCRVDKVILDYSTCIRKI